MTVRSRDEYLSRAQRAADEAGRTIAADTAAHNRQRFVDAHMKIDRMFDLTSRRPTRVRRAAI